MHTTLLQKYEEYFLFANGFFALQLKGYCLKKFKKTDWMSLVPYNLMIVMKNKGYSVRKTIFLIEITYPIRLGSYAIRGACLRVLP